MNIQHIETSKLNPSTFNPPNRTTRRENLEPLIASMKRDGFWEYSPILATEKLDIADGHRRYAVAKLLEIGTVPVIVVPGKTAEQIWSEYNSTVKRINGMEWTYAAAHGMNHIPTTHAVSSMTSLSYIKEIGEDILQYCSDHGISCNIAVAIKMLTRYMGDESQEYRRKVFFWLVTTRSQRQALEAIRDNIPTNRLSEYIEGNETLKRPSW